MAGRFCILKGSYRRVMIPKLVALTGPFKGSVIPLFADETSIGRAETNAVCIEDPSVSRRHCLIKREDGRYKIEDLVTLNSTFVNGLPVTERRLEHADEIRIGDSAFLFLQEEEWSSPVQQNEARAARVLDTTRPAVQIIEQARVQMSAEQTAAESGHLESLLRIGTVISSLPGLEALQQELVRGIFEMIPADRAAIVLTGDRPDQFRSLFGRERGTELQCPVDMKRSVLDRVLRERAAVFDCGADKRASLAVPLVVVDRVIGGIYVDKFQDDGDFTEDHARVLKAIAGPAALALKQWREREQLTSENQRLRAEANLEHNMVGQSACMQQVFEVISKVAPSTSTVLIRGDSGTGKELAARAIHRNSPRSGRPFVAINCAALNETLLESELFGHERGAFTGAIALKRGKLEEADGGSVFLDEVGELAPGIQTKLLRVLQEREFERLGGTKKLKTDIRLIAATNRDLEKAIRDGGFRQDLYYRLNVISLTMPPLRQRCDDVLALARHFSRKHGRNSERLVTGFSDEAEACLLHYDWPGNVRELENAIERAVVLGSTELIQPEDLPEAVAEARRGTDASGTGFHERVRELKRQLVLKTLDQTGGNCADAARLLRLHPNNLHRLIRSLDLTVLVKKQGA